MPQSAASAITGGGVSQYQLQEESLSETPSPAPQTTIDAAFPFPIPSKVEEIDGSAYLTGQSLVQHVAYALSDRLWTYSPETFNLDAAAKQWSAQKQLNARERVTAIEALETRLGAAGVLLGYIFSLDGRKRERLQGVGQSIIASSGSVTAMRDALSQLALLYKASDPFVAHIAAVEWENGSGLVSDYVAPITAAKETGVGLINSFSAHEAQHMALFATLAAAVLPILHVYDGVRVSRETAKVSDILSLAGLKGVFESITAEEGLTDGGKVKALNRILRSLNTELGTAYSLFEYEGHAEPEAVLVVFGSVEASLATQIAKSMVKGGEKVGVIAVRVYSPFSEEDFLAALPKNVKRIAVLGQVANQLAVEDETIQSALFSDVVAAITMSDIWNLPPPTVDVKYARTQEWSPKQFAWIFEQIVQKSTVALTIPEDAFNPEAQNLDSFQVLAQDNSAKQYVFWDSDDAPTTAAASAIAKALAKDEKKSVAFNATYDNVARAGTLQAEIRTSQESVEAPFHIEAANVTVVGDVQLLNKFDVIATTARGGVVVLKASIKPEDYEKKLPPTFRAGLVKKDVGLLLLDPASESEVEPEVQNALLQLAFIKVSGVSLTAEDLANGSEAFTKASELLETSLTQVDAVKEWAELAPEATTSHPTAASTTAFTLNAEKNLTEPTAILKSTESAAQALCFKEAYGVEEALRPELTMKNFIVKVQANKRLTPPDYDRNIFHIEFDLTGTGLKYEIGEALGIHSQNNTAEVEAFIIQYGLNPLELVAVPSRDDPDVLETRTVFQALQQNLDIFGRPGKKFYESLSEFATDLDEKKKLLAICSPDGAAEFKRRAEVDTVTYADILFEHPSAHPSFADLTRIIAPLKRREYSIASSQKVHPNAVHLLIVEVSWTDSRGRDRFGQASHYLSTLPIGAELVVSVKPSVMKLPASPTAPLIMAGLGTGLAPFRAFVQYRAWQKQQGIEIGPVMLFMGSRHQRQEYLYGEEWEAYIDAGVVTHLGAAFSRDQRRKIYIQDRMREALEEVTENYLEKEGSFYLCGPTWPVPDVAAVLEDAIRAKARREGKKVEVAREMEELKEKGRYVLEVY
ncbi:hypothetical protein EX30DRAFT_336972 [Ascodesmis nigricans]|uniref:assimilatory sulfite reductase (NADPH) n=1 Tax=Ascodesmis nigricans TaxID=341454 RepID=A0A4S2N5C9_9PEZI|nr:hypothetical protein EX30DRAFT_336972 [Ascodesmis nigricans]